MALIRCNQCGNMVSENAPTCPNCGNPINAYAQQPQNFNAYNAPNNYNPAGASLKSKSTAGILAILLGGFGGHYFYLGKPIAGIVFLVVNLLGFFLIFPSLIIWILSIIQGIMMLTMSDQDFNNKYVYTTNQFPLF